MGTIQTKLTIGEVAANQIATVKTAVESQIATWNSTYPAFMFSRDRITWIDPKFIFTLIIELVSESQVDAFKTAIDAQIVTWQATYPALTFSRKEIIWYEAWP